MLSPSASACCVRVPHCEQLHTENLFVLFPCSFYWIFSLVSRVVGFSFVNVEAQRRHLQLDRSCQSVPKFMEVTSCRIKSARNVFVVRPEPLTPVLKTDAGTIRSCLFSFLFFLFVGLCFASVWVKYIFDRHEDSVIKGSRSKVQLCHHSPR